ncbi:response regulator transcription factor [Sphingomonas baiyangensis]|uniref:Response regulator transcription factor n=1 Tax=Sphingomonas baiyangensis TaxID=2572576 RepID=A0A4U1L6A6_9SPHN|nr:response regulator transcription factor [Sphingomonas baiyangensis]TKD51863.1 response regulator transcription factor [Sphingomonas baiyangensis]
MRVLLLEDDSDAADRVIGALAGEADADITHVMRGEDALRAAAQQPFDCIILDRMNDGMDGIEVLARLRALDVRTPVLALSNLGNTRHRIEGLDAGADDYLAKPFDADELVARVHALLRRAQRDPHPEVIVLGALEVRVKARTVHWQGRFVDLSPKEFEILRYLADNAGHVVSRQMIWNACWPEYRIPPQINVIDVNLSRLRAKLDAAIGRPIVQTVRKQGFVIATDPAGDG